MVIISEGRFGDAPDSLKINVIKLRGRVARRGVRVADMMLLIVAGIAV